MYNSKRMDAYFRGELNKFIQTAENHTRNEKTRLIHFPCKACRNLRVFSDPTTIRSHVVVNGFVKDYKIWKYHGEMDAPFPMNNSRDQIIQDEEFDKMFDSNFDCGGDNGGVGDDDGVGGFHGDDIGEGPIDGDSSDDELDDSDFQSQLLRHTKEEVLVASARGLANFEMVSKSAEENICERSKGCLKY